MRWFVDGPPVNSKSDESTPQLSDDGQVLIFDADRSGGQGHAEIWLNDSGLSTIP
jgi:hypothetical protein